MRRATLLSVAFLTTFVATLLSNTAVGYAAPSVGGCTPQGPEETRVLSNPSGSYLNYFLKYSCPSPQSYQITVGVVRDDGKFIDADSNIGTSPNPFIDAQSVNCKNLNNTTYIVTYDVRIGDLSTPHKATSRVTLPCYLTGPP